MKRDELVFTLALQEQCRQIIQLCALYSDKMDVNLIYTLLKQELEQLLE